MTLSFSARITAAPDVMFQTVGDESVLLNLRTSLYLGLNPVGTRMWVALTGTASAQAAYESLLSEYEVPADQLRQDLEDFLGKLSDHGLIQIAPDIVVPNIPEKS
jgi:hypothetical protein